MFFAAFKYPHPQLLRNKGKADLPCWNIALGFEVDPNIIA